MAITYFSLALKRRGRGVRCTKLCTLEQGIQHRNHHCTVFCVPLHSDIRKKKRTAKNLHDATNFLKHTWIPLGTLDEETTSGEARSNLS